MKVKIEIRKFHSDECNKKINGLFVNDELFDYLLEEESLWKAGAYCAENPEVQQSVRGDILNHFLHCFEEFTGRNISLHDLLKCITEGEIELLDTSRLRPEVRKDELEDYLKDHKNVEIEKKRVPTKEELGKLLEEKCTS